MHLIQRQNYIVELCKILESSVSKFQTFAPSNFMARKNETIILHSGKRPLPRHPGFHVF